MSSAATAGGERPLRILFFLYHAGYLRHYREPLRILAKRGHTIHLGFTVVEKEPGDAVLAEALADEFPGRVTYATAPTRPHLSGWRRTATIVRALTDLARYVDPRYAHAPALRRRMAKKIRMQVLSGRADPVSSYFLRRLVTWLAEQTDSSIRIRLLRVLRTAERAIPTSSDVDGFMRTWQPDVVLVTPLVEYASNQVDYVKSAQRLRIPTAACIASWDNLTNKGLLRVAPDRVLVWNAIQQRELEELHEIPADRAILTGGQKFDPWFDLTPSRTAEQHKQLVGLDPAKPYLLYVCSSRFIAPHEVPFVERLVASLRDSDEPELRELGVLVRPHPQNAAQWEDADIGAANVAVWPPTGAQPDFDDARAGFYDSIAHSVAVVGVNTSAMIDAAIVGKNVFTILDPAFAATQEGTLHFHYLLREQGGFLNVARTFDEHQAQLLHAMRGGAGESDRLRAFVESFVRPRGIDRPVAPIVADAVEEVAALEPQPADAHTPVAVQAARVALLVPTAIATLGLTAGLANERITGGRAARRRAERIERARVRQAQ
jgi:hypothetical protein